MNAMKEKIMLPTIQITDHFLNETELGILKNNINKINLRSVENKDGNYGFRHLFEQEPDNEWLFKKIKKTFFPNVSLEVVNSAYHLRHNKTKVKPHTDDIEYNFILYLKGHELVYNGTGFYYKNNLNTYIGFVENRALFFDGKNNVHTDLQALGESSPRYTINIFYKL
jgi:hypothetical protein|tara:strand:+ start:29 stop:532 length:504 start_codon:yes stop_codon:yes gene_type:complete